MKGTTKENRRLRGSHFRTPLGRVALPVIAVLVAVVLVGALSVNGTFAYLVTQTESFINTFVSGVEPTGELVIEKTVTHPFGSAYVVPDNANTSFSFDVDLGSENAGKRFGSYVANESGVVRASVKAGGRASLSGIPAGARVTVTETSPGAGFTDMTGAQTTTIATDETATLSFENSYEPAAPQRAQNDVDIVGTVALTGRDWAEDDEFDFELAVYVDGKWKTIGRTSAAYDSDEPEGSKGTRAFELEDAFWDWLSTCTEAGAYSLRVTQVAGGADGITYDTREALFDVTVGDADMDGYLEVQGIVSRSEPATVKDLAVNADFENVYSAGGTEQSASARIDISKTLVDKSGQNRTPSGFVFELRDEDGKLVQTSEATNAAGQTSIALEYDHAQAGESYLYTLSEKDVGAKGVTYDDTSYELAVSLEEGSDGAVTARIHKVGDATSADAADATSAADGDASAADAAAEVPKDATSSYTAKFENTYDPADATIALSGTKTLSGRDLAAGEFTFDLYEADAIYKVASGAKALATATNAADGSFTFSTLSFDKVGTYHYVVIEEEGSAAGVTYDATRYLVEVAVTDEGGALSASASYATDADSAKSMSFANSYMPSATSVTLSGTKTLSVSGSGGGSGSGSDDSADDAATLENGEFTFELYQTDASFEVASGAKPVSAATNASDGSFSFSAQSFDAAGTYYYAVMESDDDPVKNVTYDTSVYEVTVAVADEGSGSLVAKTALAKDGRSAKAIAFENVYKAPGGGSNETTGSDDSGAADAQGSDTGDDSPDIVPALVIMMLAGAGLAASAALRRRLRPCGKHSR